MKNNAGCDLIHWEFNLGVGNGLHVTGGWGHGEKTKKNWYNNHRHFQTRNIRLRLKDDSSILTKLYNWEKKHLLT